MLEIRFGDIVQAEISDPDDGNEKPRPCLVISTDEAIQRGEPLFVIAISTQVPNPLPLHFFLLPYAYPRHNVTGLTERCVAKCHWWRKIEQSKVMYKRGRATGKVMFDIMQFLANHPPEDLSDGE